MAAYNSEQVEVARKNPNRFLEKQLADMIDMGYFTLEELTDPSRVNNEMVVLDSYKAQKVESILKNRREKLREEEDWNRAVEEDSYASYTSYAQAHPNSPRKKDAEEKARLLLQEGLSLEYERIMNGLGVSLTDMRLFVKKYPNTVQAQKVQDKINGLEFEEAETAWKSCVTEGDYLAFRKNYPNSSHCSEIESIVRDIRYKKSREDEEAWISAKNSCDIKLIKEYLNNYSIHKSEAEKLLSNILDDDDDNTWKRISQSKNKEYIQDYLTHFSENGRIPRHKSVAEEELQMIVAEEKKEPLIREEINRVLSNPYKDVADYLELCKKYPSKKNYIKEWMLGDMKRTPGRYQRDEMYMLMFKDDVYLNEPLFTPQEIVDNGILSYERVEWIREKPEKSYDDPNDVTPKETCFDTEKNNTDVFFFGVPGSGKTSVLAGLLSAGKLGDGYSFKYLSSGCMHVGYNYAVNLTRAIGNHVFPARTRIRNFTDSLPVFNQDNFAKSSPNGSEYFNGTETSNEPSGSEEDLFIQIIDAKIYNNNTGNENKISIVEMPGERTLRFAAAKVGDMTMLGDGTAKLFNNENHKIFFFVIDPNDKKLNQVEINNSYVQVSQAQALTAVADFLVEMVKEGKLKNLDSVHIIMSKSDLIPMKDDLGNGIDMKTGIDNIMHKTDYQHLVNSLYQLCDRRIGDVNKHCGHKPRLFTFTLGKILPGDFLNYDPEDSMKILNVIKANTISVGAPTVWDTICGIANRKLNELI